MTATLIACPLCGHRFDPAAHAACQTCPLHAGCQLVCCPACGHTTVDAGRSRLARWVAALLPRAKPGERAIPAPPAQLTLADIPPRSRARVVGFGALSAAQLTHLQAYGLLPGHQVRVLQHAPVTVVQIEQTELAFEAELACQIWVEAWE